MRCIRPTLLAFAALALVSEIHAQSAYLPVEDHGTVGVSYKYDRYNSAWQGDEFNRYPITTSTNLIHLHGEYGFADGWALDATVGYGELRGNSLSAVRGRNKYGSTDTSVGISWRVVDEFLSPKEWMPTVALRAAAIIKGNYDWRPQALGDGESGHEVGVFVGKSFGRYGMLADLSFRNSHSPVPDALYGSLGAYARLGQGLTLRGAYRFKEALHGYGHFRTLAGAPANAREEDYAAPEIGLGYGADKLFYEILASRVTSGFNTAKRTSVGASVSVSF